VYNYNGDSMKKVFGIILFFMCITFVSAKDNKFEVKFSECVDGDTAKFIYKEDELTARFLAVDTPETVHPTKGEEPFGKEASEYTCNNLKNADEIVLEYDEDSDKKDKYDRYLVWVFVDGELLQKKLVSKGYASVAYLYGDYKYTDILEEAEQTAEDNKLGIWSNDAKIEEEHEEATNEVDSSTNNQDENNSKAVSFIEEYKEYIILIGALIIVSIFNLKSKNKVKIKLKNKIKSDIKKRLK